MIKLLHLELHDTCEDCPYFYENINNEDFGCDPICNNPDCWETYLDLDDLKFPKWCPLPTWKPGDKF